MSPTRVAARLFHVPPLSHVHCIERGRKVVDDLLVDALHWTGIHTPFSRTCRLVHDQRGAVVQDAGLERSARGGTSLSKQN